MVNKNIFILFLFSIFLIIVRCRTNKNCPKNSHNSILIANNSNLTINWRLFGVDSIYKLNGTAYDEMLSSKQSTNYKIRTETCWEEEFRGGTSLYFLIFHNDTVQSIGWQKISGTNRGLIKKV
ncbi:MAG: hypothetical protein RL708_2555, partial [Bacteroidota bacterium]